MATLDVAVANCFMIGEEITRRADGSWSRNRVTFNLGRARVELVQNQEGMGSLANTYRGAFIHTTNLLVHDVTRESKKAAEQVANDLCVLLSFVTMSQVHPFWYQLGAEGHGNPPKGIAMHFRPVFTLSDASVIKEFLEQAWRQFRRLKRARRLPEIIEYLTTTEVPGQPLEIRLLLVSIALESLKATFARESGIPFVKGFYRRISSPPKPNPAKEPHYSFEELATCMLRNVGVKRSLGQVVTLRNEIVHFGMSRRPFQSLIRANDRCHDLLREYLLRLLGYRGRYLVYSTGSRTTATIP